MHVLTYLPASPSTVAIRWNILCCLHQACSKLCLFAAVKLDADYCPVTIERVCNSASQGHVATTLVEDAWSIPEIGATDRTWQLTMDIDGGGILDLHEVLLVWPSPVPGHQPSFSACIVSGQAGYSNDKYDHVSQTVRCTLSCSTGAVFLASGCVKFGAEVQPTRAYDSPPAIPVTIIMVLYSYILVSSRGR